MPTPVGELLVYGDGGHLDGVHFADSAYAPGIAAEWRADPTAFGALRQQLEEYFDGCRTGFDLPLRDPEGPALHREVWTAVARIPYGSTSTYASIAAELGRPRAARAVGLANARNPFAIVVPCHRLVGSRSALRGYAGGLEAKRYLLIHEARTLRGRCDRVASTRP